MGVLLAEKPKVDWADKFSRWAKPPSDTEEEKAERAARMVRGALDDSRLLASRSFEVYATGSFHNNTNIAGESDIDVAVVCRDGFFYDLPPQYSPHVAIGAPATYRFEQFRSDVETALRAQFGANMVIHDKTFNVPANTYRMEADVTPFFEYRLFHGAGSTDYYEGVRSVSRSGSIFINWHKDHYARGVTRNLATGKRFKRIARILKNLKVEIIENGTPAQRAAASRIPSFLLESLAFNAPDHCLDQTKTLYENTVETLAWLYVATKADQSTFDMWEVNCRKRLFYAGQPWTQAEVNAFLLVAFGYIS